MRRLFALALLMVLALVPAAAFAQDATPEATDQAIWNLSQKFTVTDLGFQFNYPEGWVTDSSQGIALAENQDDLNTVLDTDPKTHPKGYIIFVNGVSLKDLGIKADSKLDAVADTLISSTGMTETETRVDEPIMSRRSVTAIGTLSDGRGYIETLWVQDGNVVVFSMFAPTPVDNNVAYTWGVLLGSITPSNASELESTPLASTSGDFTMGVPKGWFTDPQKQPGVVAENQDDLAAVLSSGKPKNGTVVVMLEGKLSDISSGATDLASLGTTLHKAESWDDTVIPAEFIVAGQPALTYVGPVPKDDKAYEVYTIFLKDPDNAVVIAVFAQSKNDLATFMPTYLTMLASVQAFKS